MAQISLREGKFQKLEYGTNSLFACKKSDRTPRIIYNLDTGKYACYISYCQERTEARCTGQITVEELEQKLDSGEIIPLR